MKNLTPGITATPTTTTNEALEKKKLDACVNRVNALFSIDGALDEVKLFVAFELGRELYELRQATMYGNRVQSLQDAFPDSKFALATMYRYMAFYIFVKKYPRFLLSGCQFMDIFKHKKFLLMYFTFNTKESDFWRMSVNVCVDSRLSGAKDKKNNPMQIMLTIHPKELDGLGKNEGNVNWAYCESDFASHDRMCALHAVDVGVVHDDEEQDSYLYTDPPKSSSTSQSSELRSRDQSPAPPADGMEMDADDNPPSNTNPSPPPRNGNRKGKQANGNFFALHAAMETSTDANNTLAETRA